MNQNSASVVSCFLGRDHPVPEGIEIGPTVEIGKGGGRILYAHIAQPKGRPLKPMPAVLWIHGGGWAAGTYEVDLLALHLAAKGYFVAGIDYRHTDEATWPAQIQDCKLGVRWLRANAEKYHVNPDRIGCWGTSAGGHLCACLGTMGNQSSFEGDGGYVGVSSEVHAVVNCFGPADFVLERELLADGKNLDSRVALFGGSFKEKPELWREGSPITHVTPKAPPFLIVHGDKDRMVPYEQSRNFAAALKNAGVPVEMITVENADHDLKPVPGLSAPTHDWESVIASVIMFFDQHLE